jgi:histone acetyltransferase
MICLKNDAVIGGITYRPFWRQNVGEIAFCAVSANEQVKGYGTRLMNHLKEYVCDKESMTHLITFADNNAVGYFQKQGFTKDVMMEREKWVGYIKEYDGGTIMECSLSAQVSYTEFPIMIRQQRKCVDEVVKTMSNAHVVYPGLKQFEQPPGPGGVYKPIPVDRIKGVKEAGWTPPGPPKYRLVHPGCGDAGESESIHARAREFGAKSHRRVAVLGAGERGGGAGLLRRREGPDMHGDDQRSRRERGVLRHLRDVRRGLQGDVQ